MNPVRPTLRQRLRDHILHPELSAEQVAWSFAIGLAISAVKVWRHK